MTVQRNQHYTIIINDQVLIMEHKLDNASLLYIVIIPIFRHMFRRRINMKIITKWFLLLLIVLTPWYLGAQTTKFNEDSILNQKGKDIHGYAQINKSVNTQGYKYRKLDIPDNHVYYFGDLEGPLDTTTLPARNPTSWKKYDNGSVSRMAIYLTDTTSNWLGIVSGLNSQGVPFTITNDIDKALKHKVVMIYPSLSSSQFGMTELMKIREHPKKGGALIAFNATAPSMMSVFGYEKTSYSQVRKSLVFRMLDIQETNFIRDKNEITLRIGDPRRETKGMASLGYEQINYKPIAQFPDGTAAIIRNLFNEGAAYAFGFDLGLITQVSEATLLQAQRSYVNDFEPSLDVLYRLLKRIYKMYEPHAVILGTVPQGKIAPVLITHDIDYAGSLDSMLYYAELEMRNGVKATYFIQTKYIRDGFSEAFFNEKYIGYLTALKNMGMEIASHSVSHTPYFQHLPIGSGTEKYPDYRPFYYTYTSTFNETLLGELRVSRFLLDKTLGINTVSFRSGYLTIHEKMHIAMQETGFKYSSNITANEVLTHMPFRPTYDFLYDEELDVYEIPVTIEDEILPEMDERLDAAISLTYKIANYGGVVNILIHPNILGHKFRFQEAYIKHFKDEAWFGTMSEFGDWWSARSKVEVDIQDIGNLIKVSLTVPEAIEGLELVLPFGYEFISSPSVQEITKTTKGILLGKVTGSTELMFKKQ